MINKIYLENCEYFAEKFIYAFENHLITNTTNEDQTEYLFKLAKLILNQKPHKMVAKDESNRKF